MQIDAADLVKIATGLASLGGGFAVVKPFAEKLFSWWLSRLEARAAITDAKEQAIARIAVQHERTVGVLEAYGACLDRIDARLDRIEAHLGISVAPSSIPDAPPPVAPRRQLTDPAIQVVPPPSSPSAVPA